MYQIHPLIAHLPVGLFLGAGVLALLGLFLKRGLFKEVLVWILGLGILATVPNIYTGIQDSENVFLDQLTRELLILHERNAYILLSFFTLLFFWLLLRKKPMKYKEYILVVTLLLFGCSTVIYESITGYKLVYRHGTNVVKVCPKEEAPRENAALFKY